MQMMLAESLYEDAVIFFYLENQELLDLACSSEAGIGFDLNKVESLMRSADFLSKSRVFVETAPRADFPAGAIVDIGGIPINAPSVQGVDQMFSMSMNWIEGEFRLEVCPSNP
jgi:hypothetical protein